MSSLSAFIRQHTEQILHEWETFARALAPTGTSMDVAALRDHAHAMLDVIAADLDTPQTARRQAEKSKGLEDVPEGVKRSAAAEHGSGRAASGFTVVQMVAEFRALRASVVRLWTAQRQTLGAAEVEELIRFNEAIDQAVAESLARYSRDIDATRERFLAILGHDLRNPLGGARGRRGPRHARRARRGHRTRLWRRPSVAHDRRVALDARSCSRARDRTARPGRGGGRLA